MFWAMIPPLFTHLPDLDSEVVPELLPKSGAFAVFREVLQPGHEEIAVFMGYTLW